MRGEHLDFIGIYQNSIDRDTCDEMVDTIKRYFSIRSKDNFILGETQFENSEFSRLDYAINGLVELPFESNIIQKALDVGMYSYASHYFTVKQLTASSKEVKIQWTPPRGGYHYWHCEQCNLPTSSRVLAWMIYLNDIPSNEGETEFIWQKLRVNPEAGKLLIWPASFTHTHRGNPVYSCDKYIATGWYTFDN